MTIMTFQQAWAPISARIRALEKAAAVHASFLQVNSGSPYGADKALQAHCEGVRTSVEQFAADFANELPAAAKSAIDRFMRDGGKQIRDNTAGDARLVWTILVKLTAFESELTYCLEGPAERLRSTSELAFLHLQQLIVVDEQYQARWQDAFDAGETQCERLGAVHLLWHGIWAFKVDAGTGGRTDLVHQEPIQRGIRAGLGFVLTEWKKAEKDAERAFAVAREQAARYSAGPLAGVELTEYRFLVVVTKTRVAPPDDIKHEGVTYRHINIAVEPEVPSQAAKAAVKSATVKGKGKKATN